MKGFIEVTHEYSGDINLVHYTQVSFKVLKYQKICVHNGIALKETYEEIKELIKKAQ